MQMFVTVSTYGSALSRTITALAKCHQKQPRGRGSEGAEFTSVDRICERKCLLRFRQAVPLGNGNQKQLKCKFSRVRSKRSVKLNGKRWYCNNCNRFFVSKRISPMRPLTQRFIWKSTSVITWSYRIMNKWKHHQHNVTYYKKKTRD